MIVWAAHLTLLPMPRGMRAHAQVLTSHRKSPELQLGSKAPGVVLVVGVNGGGKTTTIGKLAHKLRQQGATARPAQHSTCALYLLVCQPPGWVYSLVACISLHASAHHPG